MVDEPEVIVDEESLRQWNDFKEHYPEVYEKIQSTARVVFAHQQAFEKIQEWMQLINQLLINK